MKLSRDAAFLNEVLNDPSVRPHVSLGIEGALDITPLLAEEGNFFFSTEHGGFLVLDKGDGVYEVHSQFLPAGRGLAALRAAREAMEFMFTRTGCEVLMTYCPDGNRGAVGLSRAAGMARRDEVVMFGQRMDVYAITRKEWQCQQSYH